MLVGMRIGLCVVLLAACSEAETAVVASEPPMPVPPPVQVEEPVKAPPALSPPPLTEKEKKKLAAEQLKHEITVRKDMADRYESLLLEKRMDATVRATGKNATTLQITFVLCNRVLWSDVAEGFGESARVVGFKKLVCADGYNTWVSGDL
jgi:hypothetical protein